MPVAAWRVTPSAVTLPPVRLMLPLDSTSTVLPAPLTSHAPGRDPTAWMDAAATPPGTLRIGLAHGSVQDFGQSAESAVRISPLRAKSAGLAYLSLGD